jgi:hypothetical protein
MRFLIQEISFPSISLTINRPYSTYRSNVHITRQLTLTPKQYFMKTYGWVEVQLHALSLASDGNITVCPLYPLRGREGPSVRNQTPATLLGQHPNRGGMVVARNGVHRHWFDSTAWDLAFLRSLCQLRYPAIASSDSVTRVFSRVGLSAPRPTPGYPGGPMFSVRVVSLSWPVPILKDLAFCPCMT